MSQEVTTLVTHLLTPAPPNPEHSQRARAHTARYRRDPFESTPRNAPFRFSPVPFIVVESNHPRYRMSAMFPTASVGRVDRQSSEEQILSEQLRLLYANANLGVAVNLLAATILAGLQWGIVSQPVVIGWWLYIILVAIARFRIARRYWHASPGPEDIARWRNIFTTGVAFAGAGWGAAGVLLYSPAHINNQVFLIFVLGGMMLGASSVLAPRPEAFLAFLIPVGMIPAIRLFVQADKTHIAMGLLAAVFTLATLVTTRRIYRLVDSSLRLQIENRDLVEDLRTANQQTAALNQVLELRVQERTAELQQSTEQLRAEIAQRQQTEEVLLRARKLESIGVLAGGIAHDFNNFLTVVQGNIEVAKRQLTLTEPAQQFLDQAANACQRAKFLSSQLLTFAKGGAPVRRVVSIAQLVTEAVHLARTGSPVGIEVNIAEGLWSAQVDSGQIGQVLHNILINAREAMTGGGTIEVQARNVLGLDAADPRVRISVCDNGRGISEEVLRRIFDPYFTTKPGGNGLGLATAYAIVVKHGGHISVDSKPGVGSTFTIDLPASLETPLSQAPIAVAVEIGTERLLVMDDDEALQILFKAVLGHLGYDVQTARDGAEAVALYKAAKAEGNGFDAVLLDLTVAGGMGGVEAAAMLKHFDPSARLIVSSGYSDAPVMSHFAEYGFDAVILKPWTVKEMSEVLRQVLVAHPVRRA
jgi:signal transduction histidine kinase/ActR/RegA family two-component response regulator